VGPGKMARMRPPDPSPREPDREQRLQTLAARAAAGQELFRDDDPHLPWTVLVFHYGTRPWALKVWRILAEVDPEIVRVLEDLAAAARVGRRVIADARTYRPHRSTD